MKYSQEIIDVWYAEECDGITSWNDLCEDEKLEFAKKYGSVSDSISLCPNCNCMTKNICGKCGGVK